MTDEPQSHEAELARLADGSLPASSEPELRAQIAKSPELTQALAEQERAISFLRQLDTPAPDSLRRWVDDRTRAAASPRRRRLPRLRLAFTIPMATAAAAVAAVVIVLAAGGASGPTLQQTTHLALAAATDPAPATAPANSAVLTDTAAGIAFPNWLRTVGWRATGARVDRVSGRTITTVFYSKYDARVGYAIVGGAPVSVTGGVTRTIGGVKFTLLRSGSATLVTWVRSGHTCVIAGHGITDQTLLSLVSA